MGLFAAYTRVSRVGDRTDTLISPELQQQSIRAWAEGHGHDLEVLPPELDASGAKEDRPILQAAIARIEAGELDGLAVWKFSRFTRSTRFGLQMLARIEDAGGQLRSASEQLDPGTVQGRMFRQIIFAFDEGEREQKAEEFDRAKAHAIARGVFIGARPPVGYRRGPGKRLEPDPATAAAVSELFRRKAAGASWGELSRWFSAQVGRIVIRTSISKIIANRTYLGEVRQGVHRNPTAHEPLVDAATFAACQVSGPRPPRGTGEPALLAGFVRCAGCSRQMTASSGRGRRVYRCRADHTGGRCPAPCSILAERLERHVTDLVLPYMEEVTFAGAARTDALDKAVAAHERAVAENESFQRAARAADIDLDLLATGLSERAAHVQETEREVARARLALPIGLETASIGALWADLSVAERRQVLGSAVGVVWVRSGRVLAERVKVVEWGAEPSGLSTRGGRVAPVRAIEWVDPLPGEIRATSAEHVAEGDGRAVG